MAITNQERIGKAMDLLRQGLAPFVDREFRDAHKAQALQEALRYMGDDRLYAKKNLPDWDVAGVLKLMWDAW
ncbi:MAG: Swt1 family HEPN domain-containing protein, partial [Betaproteobacteria bacterium]